MARKRARRQWRGGSVCESAGSWAIRWRENGKRCFRAGYPDRETAQRALGTILDEVANKRAGVAPEPSSFPRVREEWDLWIERRKHTHRAAYDDGCRWRLHLAPHFGDLRPADVTPAIIRAFVEAKLREGLNPATVGHCVRLLSTFFTDLCERAPETGVEANPVRALSKATRRLMKSRHNPKDTPFLETLDDVRRVFQALPKPVNVAFAVGAFAGLRTGEVLALRWDRIDLDTKRLRVVEQVQESKLGPVKDDETRTVPILNALLPVLAAYKLESGGVGLLFRPDRPGRRSGRNGTPAMFMRPHTLHGRLRKALAACKLPTELTWYQSTRHTFASQWVMADGSMEKLATILGHSSTEVTKRYAHLKPENFRDADRKRLDVELCQSGEVVDLASARELGQRMGRGGEEGAARKSE